MTVEKIQNVVNANVPSPTLEKSKWLGGFKNPAFVQIYAQSDFVQCQCFCYSRAAAVPCLFQSGQQVAVLACTYMLICLMCVLYSKHIGIIVGTKILVQAIVMLMLKTVQGFIPCSSRIVVLSFGGGYSTVFSQSMFSDCLVAVWALLLIPDIQCTQVVNVLLLKVVRIMLL